jgi:hypothetical protein
MYIWKHQFFFSLLLVVGCTGSSASAETETALSDPDKRFIMRLENPDHFRGTGIVISDSTGQFYIVTNRHVVASVTTNLVFDSILMHVNVIDSLGEVRSLDSVETIYLRFRGDEYFIQHPDPNVDLVLIGLGVVGSGTDTATSPRCLSHLPGYKTAQLLEKREFLSNALIDGLHVQLVGFSTDLFQSVQYHTSRFGFVSFYSRSPISVVVGDGAANRRINTSTYSVFSSRFQIRMS